MKRLLLFAILGVVAFVSTACSPTTPYAAKVNGRVIESEVIDDQLHAISSNSRYSELLKQELGQIGGLNPGGPNTVNAQFAASQVYDRVLAMLIHDELQRRNLTVTPDTRAKVAESLKGGDAELFDTLAADYRDHIVTVQAELQTILESRSTIEVQRKYYEENKPQFTETCFRQLQVVDAAKAGEIRARLIAGEDFGLLAREAAGPDGAPPRTEPTCASDEQLAQNEFVQTTLAALAVNGVTEALPVQGGSVLVQLTSRKNLTFEEAQEKILPLVAAPQALFAELLKDADIKVNPRYGDFVPADPEQDRPAAITPHQPVLLPDDSASEASGNFGGAGTDGGPIPVPDQ